MGIFSGVTAYATSEEGATIIFMGFIFAIFMDMLIIRLLICLIISIIVAIYNFKELENISDPIKMRHFLTK